MYGNWAAQSTPLATKVETAEQLAHEWDWPKDTLIHNTACDCNSKGSHGKMRLMWCGDYVGTDWYIQRRISYRCNSCGKIITFIDRTDQNGHLVGVLERQVMFP